MQGECLAHATRLAAVRDDKWSGAKDVHVSTRADFFPRRSARPGSVIAAASGECHRMHSRTSTNTALKRSPPHHSLQQPPASWSRRRSRRCLCTRTHDTHECLSARELACAESEPHRRQLSLKMSEGQREGVKRLSDRDQIKESDTPESAQHTCTHTAPHTSTARLTGSTAIPLLKKPAARNGLGCKQCLPAHSIGSLVPPTAHTLAAQRASLSPSQTETSVLVAVCLDGTTTRHMHRQADLTVRRRIGR
jgi:hypothetical protein